MVNALVVVIIIVAVFGAVFALVYHEYEKPIQETQIIEYHNISLQALRADTMQPIVAEYSVWAHGRAYTGMTSVGGHVVERIPTNSTLEIYLRKPGFYTLKATPAFDHTQATTLRSEHMLDPVGNLTIVQGGRLGLDNPLVMKAAADGKVMHVLGCVRWSLNFITVSIPNATLVTPPARLAGKVDKCYDLNMTLTNGTSLSIPISYKEYQRLTLQDYIELRLVFGDIVEGSPTPIFEDSQKRPAVREDQIVTAKVG